MTIEQIPATAETARPAASSRNLGSRWLNTFKALFGLPSQRRMARAVLMIDAIRHWEKEFIQLPLEELRAISMKLRGRSRAGQSLDRLLPEAFGLVSVASQKTLGLRPFDVQLAAGVILHHGALAEVATGEGKTLIASLPTYLNALTSQGVHVTTVNDYLARRDAEWVGPIYDLLGLSVGILQMQMPDAQRVQAYKADITYGTASEFGFDFLRDRMKLSQLKGQSMPFWAPWSRAASPSAIGQREQGQQVQRTLNFALVDEADSIFIDESRTPLIIAMPNRLASPEEQIVYRWANQVALQMVPGQHFTLDEKKQNFELTDTGKQLMRWSKPPFGPHSHAMDKLQEHIERALQAHYKFRRDQQYMIEDDKVVIIDEYTGRRMPDRHWREGLHQAVEAKEGAPITLASDHAAQVTYQKYFKLYKKLAGMSGTAVQNFWELRRVYKLWVVCAPTNRPVIRKQLPDRIFPTEDAKFDAVVKEVARLQEQGRPVLIGTRSVFKSEDLSNRLQQAGVDHQVLNARFHDNEAVVIAQAGQRGRVTIATNMAGRGTDIKLGPGVAEAGGLHVLGTERHEARRVDRQLAGRAGRQGDPGSCQFFLSLEDELLESLGPRLQDRLKERGRKGGNFSWQKYQSLFTYAQKCHERKHRRQRIDLMMYEKQRQEVLKDLGADPFVD